MVTEEFRVDPAQYVTGVERERAVRALKCYRSTKSGERRYSGSFFDELVRTSDPSRFTANDLVAINMLSVDVPRETAAWLLSDPGGELSRHLTDPGRPCGLGSLCRGDADRCARRVVEAARSTQGAPPRAHNEIQTLGREEGGPAADS